MICETPQEFSCGVLLVFSKRAEYTAIRDEGMRKGKMGKYVILSDQRESKNLRIYLLLSRKTVRRSFDALTLAQDDSVLYYAS